MHLIIIDALNLIRRIYAVQGNHCATGCQAAVKQLIFHTQPTHAVAVFDNPDQKQGSRHQLWPQYKAGRTPMPAELQQLMPVLQQQLQQDGITCWQADNDEADDLAATLACKMAASGYQATIISTDKGYCQLLAPGIQIRDYFQKRWLDLQFIEQEFGVLPAQLPDYWGLTGISSSKIPGVAGIGHKTARQLLQQFRDLEQLYQQLDKIPDKWRTKLAAKQQQAMLFRQLATLKKDLNLAANLNKLRLVIPASLSSNAYHDGYR